MRITMKNNLFFSVGIYCRLSKEDSNEESQSIHSQKEFLTKYILEKNWQLYKVYIDDGYSGTNFERPGFKQMIKDIKERKITIVITKDLSRLGRNYVQTGYYLEEFFPENNIRFIAVNDNYDSCVESNDVVPFKNIINEWYAKDISKKVRFTLDNKAKNGVPRNTVFPLFGYTYNEQFERIPDLETSEIVKFIFHEFIRSRSTAKVAKVLKERKIKVPMYYNAMKYNYNKEKFLSLPEEEWINWNSRKVRNILTQNEYLGNYITAKSKTISFKNKKRDRKNISCYIFENKYQPIIDKQIFDFVNHLLKEKSKDNKKNSSDFFSKILICDNCGMKLRMQMWTNKNGEKRIKYICRNKLCTNKATIYKEEILNILDGVVNKIYELLLYNKNNIKSKVYQKLMKRSENNFEVEKEIINCNKRITDIENYIMKLFEEMIIGNITGNIYEIMLNKYKSEKEKFEDRLNFFQKKKNKHNELLYLKIDDLIEKQLKNTLFNENIIGIIINKIKIFYEKKEEKINLKIEFRNGYIKL